MDKLTGLSLLMAQMENSEPEKSVIRTWYPTLLYYYFMDDYMTVWSFSIWSKNYWILISAKDKDSSQYRNTFHKSNSKSSSLNSRFIRWLKVES